MTKWTRDDTHEWISQIENRIEDIWHYIQRATEWCECNYVYADDKVLACMVITVIWVSHMRNEQVSRKEVFEILGFTAAEDLDDSTYYLNESMINKDLEELLEDVIRAFGDQE